MGMSGPSPGRERHVTDELHFTDLSHEAPGPRAETGRGQSTLSLSIGSRVITVRVKLEISRELRGPRKRKMLSRGNASGADFWHALDVAERQALTAQGEERTFASGARI